MINPTHRGKGPSIPEIMVSPPTPMFNRGRARIPSPLFHSTTLFSEKVVHLINESNFH